MSFHWDCPDTVLAPFILSIIALHVADRFSRFSHTTIPRSNICRYILVFYAKECEWKMSHWIKRWLFRKCYYFSKEIVQLFLWKKCLIGIHQLVKIKTGKGLSFKKKNLPEWHDFNISCWKYGWFPADFSFKILGLLTPNQLRTFSTSSSLWELLKCFRSKPPSLPQN